MQGAHKKVHNRILAIFIYKRIIHNENHRQSSSHAKKVNNISVLFYYSIITRCILIIILLIFVRSTSLVLILDSFFLLLCMKLWHTSKKIKKEHNVRAFRLISEKCCNIKQCKCNVRLSCVYRWCLINSHLDEIEH